MKISELIEAKKPKLTLDYVHQALSAAFDYEEEHPLDDISLKGLDLKGSEIFLDVESRRSERDVTATISINKDKVHLEIFDEVREFSVTDGEDPVELGKDIVGSIESIISRKEEDEDDEDYEDDED